ncbi:MAG: lipopolysaccharide biosynthesis protein [Hyphomicrobium sp.]
MSPATIHQLPHRTPARDAAGPGSTGHDAPAANLAGSAFEQILNVFTAVGERERTQRDALIAFCVRCVSAALLYATQVMLARWMGGAEYGVYVFVWTWVLMLGGLSQLGLNLTAIRLAPVYRATNDFDHLRGLVRGVRFAALGFGTAIMALGLLGVWTFQSAIENHFVLPIYLGLVCIPLYALTDVQDGLGRGHAWMATALIPPYILRPLLLLAAMAGAHAYGFEMTAATAAGAAIFATWAAAVVQTLALNGRLSRTIPAGPRRYEFGSWFKASLPLLVILVCELMLQNTDILVVSRFMSPTDVGVYFAAGKTMALIMFVHYAVGSAVANRFAALHAQGDREGLRAFVKDAVNWTFWPSLACAVLILALGKPLLSLFGPEFEDGYPVMCILVVGFLFRSSMGPAEFLLNMLGEQALCATVLAFAAILNVALNVALVPQYGLIGAAAATSISLAMAALMNSIVVWRRLEIEIAIWKNLPRF